MAPIVFINTTDSIAEEIFTLVHEIAHICLGSTGITDHHAGKLNATDKIEKYCDKVAAESLVPAQAFENTWKESLPFDSNVKSVRLRFRVSSLVAIRRAFDFGKINRTDFDKKFSSEAERLREQESSKSGGGNFNERILPARNSRRVTAKLVASALEGRLLYREAANLLGIQPSIIPLVAEAIGVR